jgi:drug/metabolite transporter superfamily protein YnfA
VTFVMADLLVAIHFAFVVFVVAGGLLVLRWPRVAWAHVPAAVWGAVVEITGWICPLTPLENWLRRRAEGEAYAGDFVARYLMPMLYPEGLTRDSQLVMGAAVVLLNVVIYAVVIRRSRRRPHAALELKDRSAHFSSRS